MPSDIKIADGSTPSLSDTSVNTSNPPDITFRYDLVNLGDEDDTTTGFYFTLDDANGTYVHSDYAPDAALPVGTIVAQEVKIAASIVGGLAAGDYWVSLRDPRGETIAAVLLTAQGGGEEESPEQSSEENADQ